MGEISGTLQWKYTVKPEVVFLGDRRDRFAFSKKPTLEDTRKAVELLCRLHFLLHELLQKHDGSIRIVHVNIDWVCYEFHGYLKPRFEFILNMPEEWKTVIQEFDENQEKMALKIVHRLLLDFESKISELSRQRLSQAELVSVLLEDFSKKIPDDLYSIPELEYREF